MIAAKIKARLDAGESPRELADELNLSPRRIYQIRGETPREPVDAVKRTSIVAAIVAGMSQREAARQFGVSRKTVSATIAESPAPIVAAPKRKGRLSDDTVAHILSRHKAGRSTGTIARELELSDSAVRAVIARHVSTQPVTATDAILAAIATEMARRGITAHGLAEMMPPPAPQRQYLFDCLRGTQPMTTALASRILAALQLRIAR